MIFISVIRECVRTIDRERREYPLTELIGERENVLGGKLE